LFDERFALEGTSLSLKPSTQTLVMIILNGTPRGTPQAILESKIHSIIASCGKLNPKEIKGPMIYHNLHDLLLF
jgi:hypothetical protein